MGAGLSRVTICNLHPYPHNLYPWHSLLILAWHTLTYFIVTACTKNGTWYTLNLNISELECNMFPDSYILYNESQFLHQIASLAPKRWDLYIVVPIFIMRIPREKNDGSHHILLPPQLWKLTILNTNTMMLPSLGQVYSALPWGQNFVGHCIVHLSMSKLSGFADAVTNGNDIFERCHYYSSGKKPPGHSSPLRYCSRI